MKYIDIILQGQQYILEKKLFKRTIKNPELFTLDKIVTILWGRRTGKTSLMIQVVQEMLATNQIILDDIVFIDFSQLSNHSINLIDIYTHYIQQGRKPFFVLDEIQELKDFEKTLGYIYQQWCKIFVSGSNSKVLSQEIATTLRGRSIEYYNDVLSFEEFLTFRGYIWPRDRSLILQQYYDEYLMRGGYPEVVIAREVESKRALLQSYYDLVIYRDIVDRYRIRNQEILGHLIKSLVLSNTKQRNIHKTYNTYKSLGYAVSKNTLYQYMEYLEHNFFITRVKNYYKKSYFDKIYIIDNGYMNLFSREENLGQKFENTLYKHLKKEHHYIGYVDESFDCDFTDGEYNRQVCYELTPANMDREFSHQVSQQKNMLIYTKNTLGEYQSPTVTLQHRSEIE